MKAKSRHFINKGEVKKVEDELKAVFGSDVDGFLSSELEIVETGDKYDLLVKGGEPLLFVVEGKAFPTVRGALKLKTKKRTVVVDGGAVKFVAEGADIMCPGVVNADQNIQKGDLVIVTEEAHGKALAIGKALMSGEEMMGEKGKAVKSLHFVGDKLWNLTL
jgi:PUA domain protein